MNSSLNNITSFSNEKLVKFMEKIGHYEAARIIQETNIDGQRILELTEMETLEWKLTNSQRTLLWNCIFLIKSNPLTFLNSDHKKFVRINGKEILHKESRPLEYLVTKKYKNLKDEIPSSTTYFVDKDQIDDKQPQPLPQYKQKYFKFSNVKKEDAVYDVTYISDRSNQNFDKFNGNQHVSLKTLDNNGKNASRRSFYYSCSSINESEVGRPTVNSIKKYNKSKDEIRSDVIYCANKDYVDHKRQQPVPYKKRYFKFCQSKNQEALDVATYISEESNVTNKKVLKSTGNKHTPLNRFGSRDNGSIGSFYHSCSSLNDDVFHLPRQSYCTESDYIYAPCLQGTKDNTTINRIKKYLQFNPRRSLSYDDRHELLNSEDLYLELSNLQEMNIYDEPITGLIEEETTSKPPVHFVFNLCCFSCYSGCTKL